MKEIQRMRKDIYCIYLKQARVQSVASLNPSPLKIQRLSYLQFNNLSK